MKKKFLSIITAFACLVLATSSVSAKEYEVDSGHSSIGFTVTHLGLSEVEGRFKDFKGSFNWQPKSLKASSLSFTAQANSISTDNKKRDNHLRGDDFFDIEKFSTLTFKSTKIKKLSGQKYAITGKLTAHGVTKTIKIPATIKGPVDLFNDGEESIGFRATFKINRIDYGIGAGWQSGSDKVVGHDVFLTIKGEAHEITGK